MNKETIVNTLKENNISFSKVKFFKESPYQKNRYKKEYVGWETWIYTGNSPYGNLITEEDWNNLEYRKNFIENLN